MENIKEVKYICEFSPKIFVYLGIDPMEAIKYIENKRAINLNPAHVKALQILKQQCVPSS